MEHPITPPPELVQQWVTEACPECRLTYDEFTGESVESLATAAAQWGWDQRGAANEAELQKARDEELEACCQHLFRCGFCDADILRLRIARRPQPPSLRKQAYDALDTYIYGEPDPKDKERTYNTIRRALEQLND